MTRQALAQDRLYCWGLISRARRVGFPVPEKWLRHGDPPSLLRQMDQVLYKIDFAARATAFFTQNNPLYEYLSRRCR